VLDKIMEKIIDFLCEMKVDALANPICNRNYIHLPRRPRIAVTFFLPDSQSSFPIQSEKDVPVAKDGWYSLKIVVIFLCNAFEPTHSTGYGSSVQAGIMGRC